MNLFLLKSLALFLLLFIVVSSCKTKENPVPEKQKANFEFANATVSEDIGGAAQVNITLEKATAVAGTLTVAIANGTGVAYATNYVTNPNGDSGSFTIEVAEGATTASFAITPIDDTEENAVRVITFTLSGATGGVELGDKIILALSIIDNDVPATVNFELATGTVVENSTSGLAVNLPLTSAAVNAGTFDVTYASADAVYTTDFTTDPDGASGTFTVSVAAAATDASFTVIPVDNVDKAPDKIVTFTISNATGGVNLGQATTYELTIINDDSIMVKTIAEIRALYDGSANVDITNSWAIEGTVTSKNNAVTGKNLFIQDATGGISIRWSNTHAFAQGDNLSVNIQGAIISDSSNLVQIAGTMPLMNGSVTSSGNSVIPEVITFTQLNSGDFQSKLVTVETVSFPEANGFETLVGNNDINDGATTATVRVESYASLANETMPIGTGNVTGIAGVYQTTNQLLPQEAAHVFSSNPSAIITVTQSLVDFSSVDSNASSASQSYTVSGTTLTEDITVTAPNQFEVSLDDIIFTSTVTITAAAAMASPVTVHVRFSPTTGFAGTPSADIYHETVGAMAQLVAVLGTEEPIGLLMVDNFNYGTTAGNITDVTTHWTVHHGGAGAGANYITTSLSMAGYPSSGIGGAVSILPTSSQDVDRVFSQRTTGTVYFSGLINVSSVSTIGNYFFHLNSVNSRGRIGAKEDGSGGVLFGIGASVSDLTYGITSFSLNTTYLVVASYTIDTGVSNLYVLNAVEATEPTLPEATNTGQTVTAISALSFRQNNNIPVVTIDGVRVATDWSGIMND